MAQFLDEERHPSGVAVNASHQERIGLRYPAPHSEIGLRSLKRLHRHVRRSGNPFRAVITRPGGEDDARAAGQLQQRLQQLTTCIIGPLPVVDDQYQRAFGGQGCKEAEHVADHALDGKPAATCFGAGRYQAKDRFARGPSSATAARAALAASTLGVSGCISKKARSICRNGCKTSAPT